MRVQKKRVTLRKSQKDTLIVPQAQPLEDNTDILDFMSVPESPQKDQEEENNYFDTSFKQENALDVSI